MRNILNELDEKYLTVVIACHYDSDNPVRCGPLYPLLNYFKSHNVITIKQTYNPKKTSLLRKLKDFILILWIGWKAKPIDIFIGVESVNALGGYLLKPRKLIYYIFDWSPRWFENPILDRLYLWCDRKVCQKADMTWNITKEIEEERLKLGYCSKNAVTVPYQMPFKRYLVNPYYTKKKLNKIVYSGYIATEEDRKTLYYIKKQLSKININLDIITDINDIELLDKLLCSYDIGIAPYFLDLYSKKRWGDVIKIRHYFACGLPVVTSKDIPLAKEIEEKSLGITVFPTADSYIDACYKLTTNWRFYAWIKENVIKYARKSSWKKTYDNAFLNYCSQL